MALIRDNATGTYRTQRATRASETEILEAADHLDPDEDFTFMRP